MRTEITGLALLAILLAACAPSPAVMAPRERRGDLVLVGGGAKPTAAVARFVELAGGAGARIVVLPLASGDSRPAGGDYVGLFGQHGVTSVTVIHVDDRRDAARAAYVRAVDQATAVWFAGGDQRRITARLVDTPLHAALLALQARGGPVGGTSAGTACQSGLMLTGDGDTRVIRAGATLLGRGLDLAPGLLFDTHFVVRDRQRRLVSAVLDHPELLGVGVDEGAAIWLRADGVMHVFSGSVIVYDGARARRPRDPRAAPADVEGLVTHPLGDGDTFDLRARRRLAVPAGTP